MAEAHKKAYRHTKYKTSYRTKNWSEYEKSLRNRGDITVWLIRDAVDAWTPPKNGKRGGQPIYSDIAIETSLTLRLVFLLPLRQAEGFLKSILKLMDLYLPCPDHTTMSRRNRTANVRQVHQELAGRPCALYRGQHRFEDLRPGRMARQEAWEKVAQTLEETPPWCGCEWSDPGF